MMHKLFILLFAVSMAVGCGTSKKATDTSSTEEAIGSMEKVEETETSGRTIIGEEWEYVIRDLPDGDATGIFTIAKSGDGYVGVISSANLGDAQMKNLVIENDNLQCNFEAMGYSVGMSGTFEGNSFNGAISAEGYDFPMTAVKKE